MKKIVCPRCAVINLEGFVTYPNCAGCGAALPIAEKPAPIPFWKRPVGPIVWATILGGAVLAVVLVATRVFENAPEDTTHIVMLVHVPPRVRVGEVFSVGLLIDTMEGKPSRDEKPLREVRLRFAREFFRRFAFVSLQPVPDDVSDTGAGRYFRYGELARGTRLQLKLRALRLGRQGFAVRAHEATQTTAAYSTHIRVRAPIAATAPVAH